MSTEKWQIDGDYFESCNCEILCPCLLTGAAPTEGHCDVVLATHIDKGKYGSTDISGLNVVQAATTPGKMSAGNGTLAVYVDSRANPEQRKALEQIFTGAAGGPPSLFGPMISKVLPTKTAPISYSSSGNKRSVSVENIAWIEIDAVTGAGKQAVWIENIGHPYSSKLAAARGTSSSYKDHTLKFENTGRNGHFSQIKWSNG